MMAATSSCIVTHTTTFSSHVTGQQPTLKKGSKELPQYTVLAMAAMLHVADSLTFTTQPVAATSQS